MERILIHENKNLLSEIKTDLKQYLPLLEKVKKSYEGLQLGNFTNDILKEIVNTGTRQIEKLFNESLEDQIEKSGISNTIVKSNLLKGSEQLYFSFLENTKELKRFKPETYSRNKYLKLNVISYLNGSFILSDEDQERIIENESRIYLENEKEKELFENLKNFVEAYDKVNENLEQFQFRFNFNQGKGIKGIENVFLNSTENGYSINPHSIKFATNYIENNLKFNS